PLRSVAGRPLRRPPCGVLRQGRPCRGGGRRGTASKGYLLLAICWWLFVLPDGSREPTAGSPSKVRTVGYGEREGEVRESFLPFPLSSSPYPHNSFLQLSLSWRAITTYFFAACPSRDPHVSGFL